MNRLIVFAGVSAGLLASAYATADESRDEKRTIPLSEIITTSPQKDLRSIDDVVGPKEAYNSYMMRFRNVSDGSSNVFLVDAKKIRDALDASSNVLFGSRSTDTPASQDKPNPERGSHWLVAFLGSGPSNPVWWTLESVSVKKGKVTLSYRKSKPRPATHDVRPYYFWIPLGKLDPGAYDVQLFDAEKGLVSLMRRVEVSATFAGIVGERAADQSRR